MYLIVSTLSSDSIREKMKKNYLSNPSYNYDQVNRASLACGPMVKWAIAQVRNIYIYNIKSNIRWKNSDEYYVLLLP